MGTVLLTILVFGAIILIHELGHFTCARIFDVRVNEFAFGMGPAIWKKQGKETTYSIRLFPVGGFCAMEGEDEESVDGRAFGSKAPWKRFIILLAGAIMNIVLGLFLLGILTSRMELLPTNHVAGIVPGTTAATVLRDNDKIVKVNGHSTPGYEDVKFQIIRDKDGVIDLEILRAGEGTTAERITVDRLAIPMKENSQGQNTFSLDFTFYGNQPTVPGIVGYAFQWTGSTIKLVWFSLADLLSGQYGLADLSGPVGTASIIQEATSIGIEPFIYVFALISVNVGVFNLLPLPALDGGRLLFVAVELFRRKPVPAKYEAWVHGVGLVLMLGLIVVVTFSDIAKLVGNWIGG